MKKPCQMCGVVRHRRDLAMHDDRWYCHPALSVGETCYTTAQATREFDGWRTDRPRIEVLIGGYEIARRMRPSGDG